MHIEKEIENIKDLHEYVIDNDEWIYGKVSVEM